MKSQSLPVSKLEQWLFNLALLGGIVFLLLTMFFGLALAFFSSQFII